MKDVDLDELASYLACTWDSLSVNANFTKVTVEYSKTCLCHVFLLEQPKNYPDGSKTTQNQQHAWSYDMEGHAEKCVERCFELANKKAKQFYKVTCSCLDDQSHQERGT